MPGDIRLVQIPGVLADLVSQFGVVGPGPSWWISDTLIPVSLVDSQIALTAVTTPLVLSTRQSAGSLTAPAANTVLADTGPLEAGDYQFELWFTQEVANTQAYLLQRRDAANTGNIWEFRVQQNNVNVSFWQWRWTESAILTNERIRILNAATLGAGEEVQAAFYWAKIST